MSETHAPERTATPGDRRGLGIVPGTASFTERLLPVLLVLAGILVYANSFTGPFLFDDQFMFVDALGEGGYSLGDLVRSRPLGALSVLLNRSISGDATWSYHVFNLLVHLGAGLLLYGVLRRGLEHVESVPPAARSGLSFCIALVWLVHPLQTESVTYISQRAESMAGLFYLGALYGLIRSATPAKAVRWQALSVLAIVLGMATKETVATAPLMLLLYDRTFLAGSFSGALLVRRRFYLIVAATWVLLFVTFVGGVLFAEESSAGFGTASVGPLEYARTQPGVILHYLRLVFWPHPLCLDYQWPLASSPGDYVPQTLLLAGLLLAVLWALVRRSWIGFAGAWFFVILAPTSSVVPIQDAAFEHRMYLPLAAVVLLAVIGGREACVRWAPGLRFLPGTLAALVVAALMLTTIARNRDYRSELAMWESVVACAPHNSRAYSHLGMSLLHAGRTQEAVPVLERATALQPSVEDTSNLGFAYLQLGEPEKAIGFLRDALEAKPDHPEALVNLGCAYLALHQPRQAIDAFEAVLVIDPNRFNALMNLGAAHLQAGDPERALRVYERALALDPGVLEHVLQTTRALAASGRSAEVGDFYARILARGDLARPLAERVRAAQAELGTGSTPR